MVAGVTQNNQPVMDEIGTEPATQPIYKNKTETIQVELGPIQTEQTYIGNSLVLGNTVNGVLGVANGVNGSQILLGAQNVTTEVERVINYNNIYIERLTYNNFEDTSNTTADWDTTNKEIDFTSGEVAQSLSVYKDDGIVGKATLSLEGTTLGNLTLELSANGGTNWETVGNQAEHTFTNTGTDLRFRFTASGNAKVTKITIQYVN